MFEFVYLARPDSVMDGISVYQARLNLGETLAQRLISTMPPSEIDVVIPIPESSRPSAMQLAQRIGKPYREGFVKNRYVGRTFIMPGQGMRKKSVRQKLNAIATEFKGRNVLLVDDSIVRGTTSQEIVQMAREAGARKVYLASAAPPVRFPNVYGIDMPTREELIAHGRSVEEIRQFIGADALIYQDVAAMKRVVGALNPKLDGFEASCFDGHYVTGDISAAEFDAIASQRARAGRRGRGRRPLAAGAAERDGADLMGAKKIPRLDLPAGLRPRHARRARRPAREPVGRELGGAVPDQQLRPPRRGDRAARFANEEEAFVYSRFSNPTVMMLERRLAALEGTQACIATASGMGAITLLGLGLLKAGDHVVCSQSVFGSTIVLFSREFAKFGIETTFVSQTDVDEWRARSARTRSCSSPRRRAIR